MIVSEITTYAPKNGDFFLIQAFLFNETRSLGNIHENGILSNQYLL